MGYENYASWPDPEGRARGDDDFDLVYNIIAYEEGELSHEDTLRFFAYLIRTGQAWTLQGSYGRVAEQLIVQGIIGPEGDIL